MPYDQVLNVFIWQKKAEGKTQRLKEKQCEKQVQKLDSARYTQEKMNSSFKKKIRFKNVTWDFLEAYIGVSVQSLQTSGKELENYL